LDYAASLFRGITAGFQPNVDAAFNNGRAPDLQYGGGVAAHPASARAGATP
jgi:ribulose 1,5-bisphosphate carboxylase large subunit-like protein